MNRPVLAALVLGLAGITVAGFSVRTSAAAPKPTVTPTPVALQYDEISRMIVAPATPPAPGSFQDDYKLAMTPSSSETAQAPTPPPRKRGLGSILSTVTNPMAAAENAAAEHAADSMAEGMMGNAMRMMSMLRNGHDIRYTYYYTKSWIREDDPLAQTATISKCQQHQFITLDLAKKTYRITDTTPKACDTMPAPAATRGGHPQTQEEAPGTVDLTMKSSAKDLGPKRIDGVATTGSDTTFEMSMTNATGSCRNGDMQMQTVEYISGIHKPRAYCPLVTPKYVPTGPSDIVEHGGCKPTMHATTAGNPMRRSSDLLEMYVLTSMSGGENAQQSHANAGKYNTLLERGNVMWLYRAQADPLFEVPPGFTEMK